MAVRPKKPILQVQQYVDEKGLSILLDIALPTLRKWRHERKGPPYVKVDRMIRYDVEKALSYMDGCKVEMEG
jgi:hypothetical protein